MPAWARAAGHNPEGTSGMQEHPCPLRRGCSFPDVLGDAAQAQGGTSQLGPRSLRWQRGWCCPLSGCQRRVPSPKLRKRRSPVPSLRNGIAMETHSPAPAARQSGGGTHTLLGILFLLMTNDGGSVLMEETPAPGAGHRLPSPAARCSPARFAEGRAWLGTCHVPIRQPRCCRRVTCGQQQAADAGRGDAGGNLLCAD